MQSGDDDINRKESEFKVESFLDDSQFYLNRLSLIKSQLHDIHRLNQPDLYIEKLNDIDAIVHDLAERILNIEQLHSQINENERLKLDQQIHFLRIEIDREMSEFHQLREQVANEGNMLSINEADNDNDDHDNNGNLEENLISNELRQRHVTTNRLNDSYDLLEQDLAYLREAIDEVSALVARQQQQTLSRTEHLRSIAHDRIHNASSFFQQAIHNRYVSLASGALLGASIGGPVGFVMGAKVGALVAFTGSALGALSMNIMQQRVVDTDEEENTNPAAYNQAML